MQSPKVKDLWDQLDWEVELLAGKCQNQMKYCHTEYDLTASGLKIEKLMSTPLKHNSRHGPRQLILW